jgi:hypothetical protein
MEPMSFVQALKHFFFREGKDTLNSFTQEYKQLTEQDKAEFKAMLRYNGYVFFETTK